MLHDYGLDLTEFDNRKALLLHDYKYFLRTFFAIKNNKPFTWSYPPGRKSHFDIIADELTAVFNLKTNRLVINVPPGYAKSTMLIYFIAWALARYPDCNFLYIAYSQELAEKHTATIKDIIQLPEYKQYFGVELCSDSKAKGNFKLTGGGTVKSFGSSGSITGQDAGLPHCDRFSGCVVIDDAHKPTEIHSDTMRQSVIDNYNQTIKPRPRGPNVPILFIGQRLHEQDLAGYLLSGADGYDWKSVVLKARDEAGNALYPEVHNLAFLDREESFNIYTFHSQYQQDPQPSGGGIFKPEWLHIHEMEPPNIVRTFVTIDSAETDKSYNDATVFSFWGLHKIKYGLIDTGVWGLHWIDCREIRVEPKDLEPQFFSFYMQCMGHSVKPDTVCIEKKSTGTTLISTLKQAQGWRILEVERNRQNGRSVSKIDRLLECQPYLASRRISFTRGALHLDMCKEHLRKITANGTHSFDDIADTMQSAIQCALIEGTLLPYDNQQENEVMDALAQSFSHTQQMRTRR